MFWEKGVNRSSPDRPSDNLELVTELAAILSKQLEVLCISSILAQQHTSESCARCLKYLHIEEGGAGVGPADVKKIALGSLLDGQHNHNSPKHGPPADTEA